jgi:poly-gamma-glutamate capsule biosynthesis protein CapA/YwtB (metallophosphatase superfamily)
VFGLYNGHFPLMRSFAHFLASTRMRASARFPMSGFPTSADFLRPPCFPVSARLLATAFGAALVITAVAPDVGPPTASAVGVPHAEPGLSSGSPAAALTLAFAGDVHFEQQLAPLLRRPDTALASLRPYLASTDLAMVNLETAITERGTAQPKQYRFRAPATALRALAGAGVDVVTMANNHGVDYGTTGLADTLAARRTSPVRIVGIGSNAADAYAPAVFTVRGRRVAVLGASQLGDWTLQNFSAAGTRAGIASARPLDQLTAAVRAARQRADVVVVYLHWGNEREACPDGNQRSAATALATAGADVVIGSHAHQVQGAGWLGRAYVAYGMGNFVWYSHASEATTNTGVLTLTLVGRQVTRSRWTPLRVSVSGVPTAPPATVGRAIVGTYERARSCAGLSARPPVPQSS